MVLENLRTSFRKYFASFPLCAVCIIRKDKNSMSNIDWAATGSMISGLGTWAAAFAAGIVAWKIHIQSRDISKQQLAQTEREISIELYDRCFSIYQTFMKYFGSGLIDDNLKWLGHIDRSAGDWILLRELLFGLLNDYQVIEDFSTTFADTSATSDGRNGAFLRDVTRSDKDKQAVRESKFYYPDDISIWLIRLYSH